MPKNRHQTYSDRQSQAALAKKQATNAAPKDSAAGTSAPKSIPKKKTAQPKSR